MEPDNEQPTEANSSRSFSRRHVLQLLAVSGGFAALDRLLPDSWITPAAAAAADTDMTVAPAVIPPGCTANAFPLRIRSTYVNNLGSVGNVTSWQINFAYDDSASLISDKTGLTAVINDNGVLQHIYNQRPIGQIGELVPYLKYQYNATCSGLPTAAAGVVGNGSFAIVHNATAFAYHTQAVAATPVVDWFLTDSEERQSNLEQTNLIQGPTAVDLTEVNVEAVDDGLKTAAVLGAAALGAAAVMAVNRGKEEE